MVLHLSRGRDWRGGERQVRLLALALTDRPGFTQHIATGHGAPLGRAAAADGLPVTELRWRLALDPRALIGLYRWRRRHPGRVVLHAHDSHALALGMAVAGRPDDRLIATRRSLSVPSRLWRNAHRVIAISRAVEAALVAGGVDARRIIRIPSGIPFARLQAETRPEPAAGSGPVIVAAGALTREKGHAVLLHAVALLAPAHPDLKLILAGAGRERAGLERLAARLGIRGIVCFQGQLPDSLPVIAAASVFVQPSLSEALGSAVLEALGLGVPVVASAVGGLRELLGEGAGLLVPPGDPAALATGIEQTLHHPAECAVRRAAGLEVARAHDITRLAERVWGVYRSAIDPA